MSWPDCDVHEFISNAIAIDVSMMASTAFHPYQNNLLVLVFILLLFYGFDLIV